MSIANVDVGVASPFRIGGHKCCALAVITKIKTMKSQCHKRKKKKKKIVTA